MAAHVVGVGLEEAEVIACWVDPDISLHRQASTSN
jgi:hypothetical protein